MFKFTNDIPQLIITDAVMQQGWVGFGFVWPTFLLLLTRPNMVQRSV